MTETTAQVDLAWTLTIIKKAVSLHKHQPKLTAAERVMDDLPLHDARFALSLSESLDYVVSLLDD